MNTRTLESTLLAKGCNPSNFSIRSRGCGDLYCIDEVDGNWSVFYTERGSDSPPLFESTSESEACNFFYDLIMKMDHWHLVGFYEDEDSARKLEQRIAELGIDTIRNDIPAYHHAGDARYRVFVVGEDIFTVKKHINIAIN